MSVTFHECLACRALFRKKEELKAHKATCSSSSSKSSTSKSVPRRDPHAFTAELESGSRIKTATFSRTVPDSVLAREARSLSAISGSRSRAASSSSKFEDATLLGAMESGMKKPVPRKSGLEVSILSAIAEGDSDLVTAYRRLSIDPKTGSKTLTPDIVGTAAFKAKIDVDRVANMIKRAQKVSLCFLLDTTGSMAPYINGVKDQIVQIVTEIQASCCSIAGLAFVGYKDWCDGENHFEILPFTRNLSEFKSFVAVIEARGGGDMPEDVIGGLSQALNLQWPESSGSRILFHMADAPPHGREKYHYEHDDYPTGHPKDIPLTSLFQEMKMKEVAYYFGRINKECDQMLRVFEPYYGGRIDAMESTKVATLSSHVTASVMKTVTSSLSSTLSTIKTSGSIFRRYVLDEIEPDWSGLPTVVATIITYKLPESISEITSFARMEDVIRRCRAQIAPNPFAKGSVRLAYYGQVIYVSEDEKDSSKHSSRDPSLPSSDKVVFKEMITLPKVAELDRQRYMADLEVQTVSSKLAFEFNDRLSRTTRNPNLKLKFLMAKMVRFDSKEDGKPPRFMAYEKRFHGPTPEMVKYTNNLDFVLNPGTMDEAAKIRVEVAIAFSHFTHSITDGYLLVCDLQGITTMDKKRKPTLLLTDPAIHCPKHLRFGKTNLGALGVNKFFAKHKCNSFCNALGLEMPTDDK